MNGIKNGSRVMPNLVVSTVVIQNNLLLVVQEGKTGSHGKWNIPSGRLKYQEKVVDAAVREVLEETGLQIRLTGFTGMYRFFSETGALISRLNFVGEVLAGRIYCDEKEILAGGENTVFDESFNAFGHAANNLNAQQKADFVVGNSFFKLNWVTAPASTTDRDGLGILFNAASCSACHDKDGRGLLPKNGEQPTGLLFRLSSQNGEAHPNYVGQLQNRAILGVQPEAHVQITYSEITGKYADGETYSLRKPTYKFLNPTYGNIENALVSPRLAPQIIGMGLLEAIDEATILSFADENDQNKDGISGKANKVWDEKAKKIVLGRFGWKSNQPSVLQQTAGAFLGDMGITSSLFPNEEFTENQKNLLNLPNGGKPEIEDKILDKVVLYTAALAVPARRNAQNSEVLAGKQLFNDAKCNACHIPKITTGQNSNIAAFNNQTIFPYTDLLLHDLGEDLADHRPDFLASGTEWRTPPLWGIGLIKTVNGERFLLHDGRARSLEEAIIWHGGEAETAKQAFLKMPKNQRSQLVAFLESL